MHFTLAVGQPGTAVLQVGHPSFPPAAALSSGEALQCGRPRQQKQRRSIALSASTFRHTIAGVKTVQFPPGIFQAFAVYYALMQLIKLG